MKVTQRMIEWKKCSTLRCLWKGIVVCSFNYYYILLNHLMLLDICKKGQGVKKIADSLGESSLNMMDLYSPYASSVQIKHTQSLTSFVMDSQ